MVDANCPNDGGRHMLLNFWRIFRLKNPKSLIERYWSQGKWTINSYVCTTALQCFVCGWISLGTTPLHIRIQEGSEHHQYARTHLTNHKLSACFHLQNDYSFYKGHIVTTLKLSLLEIHYFGEGQVSFVIKATISSELGKLARAEVACLAITIRSSNHTLRSVENAAHHLVTQTRLRRLHWCKHSKKGRLIIQSPPCDQPTAFLWSIQRTTHNGVAQNIIFMS